MRHRHWPCWALIVSFAASLPSMVSAGEPQLLLRWEYPTHAYLPQAMLCDPAGEHLFVALKSGGIAILDVRNDESPRQVGIIGKADFGQLDAMNLALVGDRLFVALGDLFAKNSHAGLATIDVAVPRRPRVLSVWKSDEPMHGSAVVVASGRHAFLGAMSHGVLIFDVSDPTSIRHVTTTQPDINFPTRNPSAIQHPNARGMAIDGNLLFVAYDAGGLRLLDVTRPEQPREIGRYINPRMAGKQQAYNNVVIDGHRAYLATDYAGLEIVDISNPRRIRQIAWWNPWKADTLQNLWINSPGHINQLVLDPQRNLVYLSAGDSELQVVDVSSEHRPVLTASYGKPRNGLGVWGLAVAEDRVYLGYIQTIIPFRGSWSGIKALNVKADR